MYTVRYLAGGAHSSRSAASAETSIMEAKVYNQEGKEVGKVALPEEIFGLPWNADLVHQVVVGMQANARTPVAHAHDRSEQRGGGRKPWRQKGTGRARHGSRRSPIWRGGGVTHGPRNEKDYSQKINAKMRAKALYTVLSRKVRDNEVVFVDTLSFSEPKTKVAQSIIGALSGVQGLEALGTKEKNAALITLPGQDAPTQKSFRNIPSVTLSEVRNLNPVQVLSYKYLIVANPKEAFETLASRRGNSVSKGKSVVKKADTLAAKS